MLMLRSINGHTVSFTGDKTQSTSFMPVYPVRLNAFKGAYALTISLFRKFKLTFLWRHSKSICEPQLASGFLRPSMGCSAQDCFLAWLTWNLAVLWLLRKFLSSNFHEILANYYQNLQETNKLNLTSSKEGSPTGTLRRVLY